MRGLECGVDVDSVALNRREASERGSDSESSKEDELGVNGHGEDVAEDVVGWDEGGRG